MEIRSGRASSVKSQSAPMIVVETANVRTMLLVLEACASANLDGMAPLVKNMDV